MILLLYIDIWYDVCVREQVARVKYSREGATGVAAYIDE